MQNKSGKQSMMIYVMALIAAFSIALLANVNAQLTGECIEKSDGFSNTNDATLEISLNPSRDATLKGNSGDDGAQTQFSPIKYSPAPLLGPLGIADAGNNQVVNEGDVVQFDGSGSYDPLGTIDGYYWDLDTDVDSDSDGNTTNDIDATGPTPTHIFGDDGTYNVSLRVSSIRQSGGTVKVDQDVVLIIDSSGSMSWNDPDDIRIDAAKHYVYMLTPDDRVAVVDFDDQTTLLQALTMNYYAAMLALDLIDSSGGTTLSPALDESITELEVNGNSAHVWAIILLTDAENLKQWDITECYAQTNRAVNDDIVIYTIGLNIDTPQEKQLLADIANLTGGKYYSPPNASHLYEIYDEISEEVENTTSGMVNDTDTIQIKVENVDPAIGSFSASGGDEGAVITYTSTATDPGSDDLRFTWNWGDGSSDTVNIYYNDGVAPEPIYDKNLNMIKSPGGTFPFSATETVDHTYGDDGVFAITLTVEDDDGGKKIKTANITVTNVAPTIGSVSTPGGEEGAVITYSSTATDPGSDDLTFTWNWGDGTSDTINIYYNDGVGPDPDPSPLGTYPFSATDTVDHAYGDNGVYTITLTVEDDDGGKVVNKTTVTINNVVPTIDTVLAPPGDEGAVIEFSSTATDPGSDDLTFTWNWGDGTSDSVTIYYNNGVGPDPFPSPWGTFPFSVTDTIKHTYGDDGVYTITLTVEDDDNGVTVKTTTVTISNVAPSIDTFDPPDGYEGVVITYSSTATDPGSDDLTFTWNWGDGTSDTITIYYNDGMGPEPVYDPVTNDIKSPWGTFPFSATDTVQHTYGDNGIYTITLTVKDDDGGVDTKTQDVEIFNVAPTIDIFLVPESGDEGAMISFSSTATDPGSDDLTFTWNWGDGTSDSVTIYYNNGVDPDPYPSPWGTFPFSATDMLDHIYGDNWDYTVTLTVEDDDGGVTENKTTLTIHNVAPTVNIVGSLLMFEGAPVDLTATSTDPGSDDLKFTWEFELGPTIEHMFYNDGIGPDPLPSPLGIYPFTITDTSGYLYGDNGYYEIKLTVEDDDGGSTVYTNFIDVQNVAPSVEVEAYALVDFTLRIAGEKWHDVRLYIYEDDVEVGFVGVVRYPGSPDDQSVTISNVKCHVTAAINATVYYTPDDDPINGQRNGANPCWIKIGFEDGSYEILKHTFNVRHPETWEWNIGMNHYFVGHKITFKADTTDPGSDDLTCIWNWGDGSPTMSTTYYNNGLTPEPIYDPITNDIKSPGGIYPCAETEMKEHTYTSAGNYIATLTVTDDDGDTVVYTLNINLS